jgi:hypothetical protein
LNKYKAGKTKESDNNDIRKFLIINEHLPFEDKMHVALNESAIEAQLQYAGCFILVSNWIKDTQEAINIYISKNFIEKTFEHSTENLGFERLYLENTMRQESIFFVAFVGLILISRIYQSMSDSRLIMKLTYKSVIKKIRRLSYFYDHEKKVTLNAISKEVIDLFEIFNVEVPSKENIAEFIKML